MSLLGELGIVKGRLRRFEIGATILFVAIEKERVKPSVEIVMARDVIPCTAARIELLGVPDQVTQPPLQPGPARQYFGLVEQNGERVGDGTTFDHEGSVHIGFTQPQFGVEQDPALGVGSQKARCNQLAAAVTAGEFGAACGGECHRPAADEVVEEVM